MCPSSTPIVIGVDVPTIEANYVNHKTNDIIRIKVLDEARFPIMLDYYSPSRAQSMLKASAICLVGLVSLCGWANSHETARYEIALASFAPLNTDVFIADGDGNNPKALCADPMCVS